MKIAHRNHVRSDSRAITGIFRGSARHQLICVALALVPSWMAALGAQDEVAAPPPESLLAEVPADAWLVAHVEGTARDEWAFVWDAVTGPMGDPLRESLAEIAPGSITLALTGLPAVPFSIGVTIAFETPLDADALMSALAARVAPAWNRSPIGRVVGRMSIDEPTSTVHLTLFGKMPVVLACVTRDGIAYLSSTPGAADSRLAGNLPTGSFLETDDYARAVQPASAPPSLMIHLNLRTLVPLAESSLSALLEGLGKGLSIGDIETVTLLQPRPDVEVRPEGAGDESTGARRSTSIRPANLSRLRLAIGVKEISPGPLRLLAPAPSESTLQRFHPRGTDLFIHGAMARATDMVQDVAAIAGAIDPAIVREYEDEREDFRRETGLEPHAEFLANFAGEWSFGGRVRPDGIHHPLIAVGLRDGRLLRTHIRTLEVAFQLETTSNPYRNQVIHHALRKNGPFSYAILDDVLLLSPEPQTVADAIDAALDGKSLADDRRFEKVRPPKGDPASRSVYVNAAGVAARFLTKSPDGAEPDPTLTALARSAGGVMLTTRAMEKMIAIDLVGSEKTIRTGVRWLASFVRREAASQRRFALRQVSMSRIRQLTIACLMFADAHERQWPRSLEDLSATEAAGDPEEAREMLTVPYPATDGSQSRYLYKPPIQPHDALQPVIGEPNVHDGGACFGFADGHAEWVESPQAEQFIAALRRTG